MSPYQFKDLIFPHYLGSMPVWMIYLWWVWFPLFGATNPAVVAEWGFFGHQQINRLAVFTLPEEMIDFYKYHLDYLESKAVNPDMRRYVD